jgi:hypothetical protein
MEKHGSGINILSEAKEESTSSESEKLSNQDKEKPKWSKPGDLTLTMPLCIECGKIALYDCFSCPAYYCDKHNDSEHRGKISSRHVRTLIIFSTRDEPDLLDPPPLLDDEDADSQALELSSETVEQLYISGEPSVQQAYQQVRGFLILI